MEKAKTANKGNPVTSVLLVKRRTKKNIPVRRLPFPWIGIEFYNFIKDVNATVSIPPFLSLVLIFYTKELSLFSFIFLYFYV